MWIGWSVGVVYIKMWRDTQHFSVDGQRCEYMYMYARDLLACLENSYLIKETYRDAYL